MAKTFVGVDGCKAGWFYFRKEGEDISFGVGKALHKFTAVRNNFIVTMLP